MSIINQKISKISIGIQPAVRMFRVSHLSGLIIDDLMNWGKNNSANDSYFSEVTINVSESGFIMRNEIKSHFLNVRNDNIIFTHEYSGKSCTYVKEVFESDFGSIWSMLDKRLETSNIRRLGIVAEWDHESTSKNISKFLMKKLTTLETGHFPAKFSLQYEGRRPTKAKVAPDIKKDDLVNTIFNIGEGTRKISDRDEPVIHLSIDTQRYYAPPLNSGSRVIKEVSKLFETFATNIEKAYDILRNLEIISE